ncbi:MAG TPA: helix-turn-helix domain-containing protein [Myxococcales bacterium]
MTVPAYPALTASPRLLTVAEVAAHLGVCTATVYRMAQRGELPHVRVGNNVVRVAPADLEAFIAAGRTGSRR